MPNGITKHRYLRGTVGVLFRQCLHAGRRREEFLRNCPLIYTGKGGNGADHIVGTLLLNALSGHRRYALINGVRGERDQPRLVRVA